MYLHSARIGVVCLVGLLLGCNPPPTKPPEEQPLQRHQYRRLLMGVQAQLHLYAPTEEQAENAAATVFKRINELDAVASNYRKTSELARLCRNAGGPPAAVSDDLYLLLQKSLEISAATDGAFDITVGPLVELWKQSRQSLQLPDPAAIAEARQRVGWQKIRLDPENRTAQLLVPGMNLDFGGIAKGHAGDLALQILREHGLPRAMFVFGGEVVVGDPPPNANGWKVEILGSRLNPDPHVITLANRAVSTSGDLEQSVTIDGRRYSHVMDPRTGLGLTTRSLATVIAPTGILADALSTAASILGPEQAAKLTEKFPGVRVDVRTAPE